MKNLAAAGPLVWIALSASAGCSAVLGNVPTHVRAALGPFVRQGYACSESRADDQSPFRQWQCDDTTLDGVHHTVILDADDQHLKNVIGTIDQSPSATTDRDAAIRFFDEIANVRIGELDPSIKTWIGIHLGGGAQEWFGSVFVTLGELKPVTHLVLFDSA
jgi:hypothetical protein